MCELDNVFVWACVNVTLKSECAYKLCLIAAEFRISFRKPPINPFRMQPSSPLLSSSLRQNLLFLCFIFFSFFEYFFSLFSAFMGNILIFFPSNLTSS